MIAFLQAIDENVWLAVEEGWTTLETHPPSWFTTEKTVSNYNREAINGVSEDEFKIISTTKIIKDALF
jgi:hypothetical protein